MEEMITREQMEKLKKLQDYLRSLESVAVAFSSGVDSTFLLKVAKDTLGDKVMAVTAQSCSFPKRELKEAIAFCEKEGIPLYTFEKECGLGNGTIRGWEKGSPRLDSLEKVAKRMGMQVKDLLE